MATRFPILLVAALLTTPVVADDAAIEETPIFDSDREHWSFRPLRRPALPEVKDRHWPRTPIDYFILHGLEREELAPQREASKETLLRRLSFDLNGLPPSPEQIDGFLADNSPEAYERVVDRLLASPAYGERWAQHWLDLARFAETDGYEHDKVRADAWKYRDWVIDALNRDLPFDRFVQLQLAGDQLEPGDPQAAIATMFCLAGPDMPDMNSQEERKSLLLSEIAGSVGSALLGLQLGCAQCHDHKYDPISQADFYRFRAIFEPAIHLKKDQSVSTLQEKPGETFVSHLLVRGDWRRKGPEVQPAFVRIANPWDEEVSADGSRRVALADWITRPDHPLTTRVIVNRIWLHHFGEGLCRSPSDFGIVGTEPEHGELLDWLATELVRGGWSMKAMHRLIVMSAVYRQSSNAEFGLRNAELSPSASPIPHSAFRTPHSVDPDNEHLSRFPRRRLEGEAIRDAMLAASGSLDLHGGGKSVAPPLPEELVSTLLKGQWEESPDLADHYRRSIYVFARRNLRYPIFEAFDRPDGNASCPRRNRSTIAPQSLLLLNSRFSLDAAQHLAGFVLAAAGETDEQIALAFRRTLGRRPTDSELSDCRGFLDDQAARLRSQGRGAADLALPIPGADGRDSFSAAAMTDLCVALFNTNEFVYID
jgi:hypothetical protein